MLPSGPSRGRSGHAVPCLTRHEDVGHRQEHDGVACLGKSHFEATEPFRADRFFKSARNLSKVPGAVWLRQRLDAIASSLREYTDELSMRLLAWRPLISMG